MTRKRWTQDEVDYLIANVAKMTAQQMADVLCRDVVSVRSKIQHLRTDGMIDAKYKRMILSHAEKLNAVIAYIGRKEKNPRKMADALGVSRSCFYVLIHEAYEEISRRKKQEEEKRTERGRRSAYIRSYIRDHYGIDSKEDIADHLCISVKYAGGIIRKMKRDGILPMDNPKIEAIEDGEILPMTYEAARGRLAELEEQFNELTERIANAPTLEDAMRLMDARNRIGCELQSFANRKPDDVPKPIHESKHSDKRKQYHNKQYRAL